MLRPVLLLVFACALVACGAEDDDYEEDEEKAETTSELVTPSQPPSQAPKPKKSDTLSRVAQRYGTSVDAITKAPCKTCR